MAIIGIKRPDGSSVQVNTSTLSKEERMARELLDDSATFESGDPDVLKTKEPTPQYPEGVTQKRFLEQVGSALSDIEKLRERQLELTERAEDSASPEFRDELEAESDLIDTEILRLSRENAFDGQTITQGLTLIVQDELNSFSGVNSYTGLTSIITGSLNADFTPEYLDITSDPEVLYDPIGDTKETLEGILKQTRRAYADHSGKISEAEDNLEANPKVTQVDTDSDEFQTITQYDEAKRAADTARKQILNLALESDTGGEDLPFHKEGLNVEKILSLLDGS